MIKMRAGDSEEVTGGTKSEDNIYVRVWALSVRELRSVTDTVALTDRCLGEGGTGLRATGSAHISTLFTDRWKCRNNPLTKNKKKTEVPFCLPVASNFCYRSKFLFCSNQQVSAPQWSPDPC